MAVTIQVTEKVWNRLKNMKTTPSETFSEIIEHLIINQIKKGGNKK